MKKGFVCLSVFMGLALLLLQTLFPNPAIAEEQKPGVITGTVSLPAQQTAKSNLAVQVIAFAGPDSYSTTVVIPQGQRSADYTLTLPSDKGDYHIKYALLEEHAGIVARGYVTAAGGVSYREYERGRWSSGDRVDFSLAASKNPRGMQIVFELAVPGLQPSLPQIEAECYDGRAANGRRHIWEYNLQPCIEPSIQGWVIGLNTLNFGQVDSYHVAISTNEIIFTRVVTSADINIPIVFNSTVNHVPINVALPDITGMDQSQPVFDLHQPDGDGIWYSGYGRNGTLVPKGTYNVQVCDDVYSELAYTFYLANVTLSEQASTIDLTQLATTQFSITVPVNSAIIYSGGSPTAIPVATNRVLIWQQTEGDDNTSSYRMYSNAGDYKEFNLEVRIGTRPDEWCYRWYYGDGPGFTVPSSMDFGEMQLRTSFQPRLSAYAPGAMLHYTDDHFCVLDEHNREWLVYSSWQPVIGELRLLQNGQTRPCTSSTVKLCCRTDWMENARSPMTSPRVPSP